MSDFHSQKADVNHILDGSIPTRYTMPHGGTVNVTNETGRKVMVVLYELNEAALSSERGECHDAAERSEGCFRALKAERELKEAERELKEAAQELSRVDDRLIALKKAAPQDSMGNQHSGVPGNVPGNPSASNARSDGLPAESPAVPSCVVDAPSAALLGDMAFAAFGNRSHSGVEAMRKAYAVLKRHYER